MSSGSSSAPFGLLICLRGFSGVLGSYPKEHETGCAVVGEEGPVVAMLRDPDLEAIGGGGYTLVGSLMCSRSSSSVARRTVNPN